MVNGALFIDIATLLWAANISAVKDKAGNPIVPDTLTPSTEDFPCKPLSGNLFEPGWIIFSPGDLCHLSVITLRFPEAVSIVAQTKELFQ